MQNDNDIRVFQMCELFSKIDKNDLVTMLRCISPVYRNYNKGEYIFSEGDTIDSLGIVIKGDIVLEIIDYWGNRSVLSKFSESDVFGESYACSENKALIMDAVAQNEVRVAFIKISKILNMCKNLCGYHKQLNRNLLDIVVNKNLSINAKSVHISQRNTRNKILSYLTEQSSIMQSNIFDISFDRQGLADYLCVDRSALSNELSKLKNEHLIDFSKNHFVLLNDE